jgi:hypothetical protein
MAPEARTEREDFGISEVPSCIHSFKFLGLRSRLTTFWGSQSSGGQNSGINSQYPESSCTFTAFEAR